MYLLSGSLPTRLRQCWQMQHEQLLSKCSFSLRWEMVYFTEAYSDKFVLFEIWFIAHSFIVRGGRGVWPVHLCNWKPLKTFVCPVNTINWAMILKFYNICISLLLSFFFYGLCTVSNAPLLGSKQLTQKQSIIFSSCIFLLVECRCVLQCEDLIV